MLSRQLLQRNTPISTAGTSLSQYKFLPFLGAVADFNGTYGTLDGVGAREHTFLFGPQVSLPARVSPFAHALFGVAKESQDPIPPPPCPVGPILCTVFLSLGADQSFATAVGGGIDVKLVHFVKLRLVQFDYVRTQFTALRKTSHACRLVWRFTSERAVFLLFSTSYPSRLTEKVSPSTEATG